MLLLSAKVPETDIFFRDKKKIENVLDWPAIVKKYYAVVKNAPKTWKYYNFAFFRGFSKLLFILRDFVNRGAWCWLRKVIKDFGYNQRIQPYLFLTWILVDPTPLFGSAFYLLNCIRYIKKQSHKSSKLFTNV